jgi:hypothetical protein
LKRRQNSCVACTAIKQNNGDGIIEIRCKNCNKVVKKEKYLDKNGECFECGFKRILHDPEIQAKAERKTGSYKDLDIVFRG